ncbi:hypothetical protein [Streptomyces axinellae]|uniref:hypothetical protein n=1 Tax=Streptomyces axinellae TaxID=552788 RepID=UPI0031D84CE0
MPARHREQHLLMGLVLLRDLRLALPATAERPRRPEFVAAGGLRPAEQGEAKV